MPCSRATGYSRGRRCTDIRFIAITTAGEKPNVKVGQLVAVSKLEALPWAANGRNGVAFRATEIKAVLSSVKSQAQ